MVSYVILLNAIFKSPLWLCWSGGGGGGKFQIKSKLSQLESEGKKYIYFPHSSLIFCIRTEFEFSEYFIHNVFSYGGLQA